MIIDSTHPLAHLLGLPLGSPELVSTLRLVGEVSEHSFPLRNSLHITALGYGLDLKFGPADDLVCERELGVPGQTMVLTAVFFHPEGYRDYKGYSQQLPYDLKFDQSRAAVRALLGPPSASSSHYENDRWEFGPLYLTLDFVDDESRIQQVCVGLIWKEEP